MKLIIKKKEKIIKLLQIINGIIEKQQTLPILENVLIKSKGKKIFFLSSNLEIQIKTYFLLKEEIEKIYITVAAKKLLNILRSLSKNKEIIFYIIKEKLNIKCGKSNFLLQTLNPSEFPIIKKNYKKSIKIFITQKKLKYLINMVYFSMALQDVRYYLNGILLTIKNNKIYTVATNGHRLAFCKRNIKNKLINISIILPRKTIFELQKLLEETDEKIILKIINDKIKFTFSNIELISKLIKGKFPNYKQILPTNNENIISINREHLLKSLKRVSLMTNEKFQGVKWIIKPTELKLITTNSLMEQSIERIKIEYKGEKIDIGFNINYLLDILNNIKSININILFNKNPNLPVLINIPNNKNFKYIIMPMYI